MSLEKLKKSYKPNVSKFRRKWVNLFRNYSKKNKLQPSAVIVFVSFILSVIMSVGFGYNKYGFLPFAIGCSFVLISFIYFTLYPLSWEEMTEEEKEAYRFFNRLPENWDLDK
jgi:hypothetical protein